MTLGERIRQLRSEQGLSQRQLGERAGINYSYLSKIENARLDAPPSLEVLRSLARTLHVDELELLTLTDHLPADLTMFAQNSDATRFFRRAAQIQPSSNDWREMFEYMEQRASSRSERDEGRVGELTGRGRAEAGAEREDARGGYRRGTYDEQP